MTKASSNSAIALTMAKEIWCHPTVDTTSVQEFVNLINHASLSLIKICENIALNEQEKSHKSEPK